MGIFDAQVKEVIHPVTKKREYWTDERIDAYQVNNGVEVKIAPKKKPRTKKPTAKLEDNE